MSLAGTIFSFLFPVQFNWDILDIMAQYCGREDFNPYSRIPEIDGFLWLISFKVWLLILPQISWGRQLTSSLTYENIFVICIWRTSHGCTWLKEYKILFVEKINSVVVVSARFFHLPIHVITYMKLLLVDNNSQLREFVYNKSLGLCYIKLNWINFFHS